MSVSPTHTEQVPAIQSNGQILSSIFRNTNLLTGAIPTGPENSPQCSQQPAETDVIFQIDTLSGSIVILNLSKGDITGGTLTINGNGQCRILSYSGTIRVEGTIRDGIGEYLILPQSRTGSLAS